MFQKLKKSPGQRLCEFRKAKGLSRRDFAGTLSVTHTTIMRWEQDAVELSQRTLALLEHAHNISLEWLLTGEGDMFVKDGQAQGIGGCGQGAVAIPFLDKAASSLAIDKYCTYDRLGIAIKNLVAIRVEGDSMAPTFNSNDIVIADKAAPGQAFKDGIWVFSIGGAVHIKRVQHRGRGFQAISDNRDYPPFDLEQPYELIGRVVWSDRRW